MLDNILVAVDASDRAPTVFDVAAALASKFGGVLRVVQVITIPPEFPAAAAGGEVDALPLYMKQVALENIAKLWKRVPGMTKTESIVESGEPWRVILEVAKRLDVDLIVVGSHGYHGWDHLIGTTAGQVANRAVRNVFVVHERDG
jgi:nucleotide-binding universal stress UspA family protein